MQHVIHLSSPIEIFSWASAVGRGEYEGPLGSLFDFHDDRDTFGQPTWEKAESELSHASLALALKKANLSHEALSFLFSGDLQNQCVASSFGHVEEQIPFLGLYGACSTCTEGLLLASLSLASTPLPLIAAAVTSSHNSAAERQFRSPIEYGGQRTPTAQWTTTASGAFLLRKQVDYSNPCIVKVMPGIMVDGGISDAGNMGAAMAPAAASSLISYFEKTDTTPSHYDAIVTGDLGWEGASLLNILLGEKGVTLGSVYEDCGRLIYDPKTCDCHAGGSGCGCSASVLSAYYLPKVQTGEIKRMLFLSTGALMSPSSVQQGCSILGIAPVIEIVHLDERSAP
jgi:stage V sporulation protein AD